MMFASVNWEQAFFWSPLKNHVLQELSLVNRSFFFIMTSIRFPEILVDSNDVEIANIKALNDPEYLIFLYTEVH